MFVLTQDALVAEALPLLGFGLPGGPEWIIILVVALLVFGRRLPDVARSIGKSIVEFKKGINEVKDDIQIQSKVPPPPKQIGQAPAPIQGVQPSGSQPNSQTAPTPTAGADPAVSPAPTEPSASNENNAG